MPGKTKSTIMIDSDLWKRLRVVAILNEFEISELVEEALREKLARMQQQPEQDPAYKDVENVRYTPKRAQQEPEPEPQSKRQPQRQNQDIFKEDRSRPRLRKDETVFPFYLPRFTFPTNKEKLMQYLELQKESGIKRDIELIIAKGLPDSKREYNKLELEAELSRVAHHKGKTTITWMDSEKTEKIVGIGIDTAVYPHHLTKEKEKEKPTLTPS